jgi:hypothetical protein
MASLRAFGPRLPRLESCSALAVSHGFGGLRHTMRCGSVAPRCRPWGSPGCRLPTWSVPGRASTSCRGPRPGLAASTREGGSCRALPCRWLHRWSVRRRACQLLGPLPGPKTGSLAASVSAPAVAAPDASRGRAVYTVVLPPRSQMSPSRLPRPGWAVSLSLDGRLVRPALQAVHGCEATGPGRPTFAVATLPPPHEVGSDPPALPCLRAVLSGAVPFEAFPSSTARRQVTLVAASASLPPTRLLPPPR